MTTRPSIAVRRIFNARDETIIDRTAVFYELEPFDSLVEALRWSQINRRLPMCVKRTLHNRFMLPNVIYVGYAIALLVIDYSDELNPPINSTLTSAERSSILDRPVQNDPFVNQLYMGT